MQKSLTLYAHIHCNLGSCWVTNANEMSTNNMKCTWPAQKNCVGDQTQPIFHWLALGFCVGGNANFMFRVGGNVNFRYQHVCIPNAKSRRWGSKPSPGPNVNAFALQWNIGYMAQAGSTKLVWSVSSWFMNSILWVEFLIPFHEILMKKTSFEQYCSDFSK